MNCKVSVCMASFNGSKFILKQVESILSQLDSNDELIISDDGSTDKTLEIINNLNDSRIKIFNHKYNKKKPYTLQLQPQYPKTQKSVQGLYLALHMCLRLL